ncbi:MAG: hypothetical protein J0H17_00300 [Rhizobiales bacterium]|nr:hypothetical protein [Hyphomicrobiales bacterium]
MTRARGKAQSPAEFQAIIAGNRMRRMGRIDAMSPALRGLVNDYGYHVVDTCIGLGVGKPRQIRHLVETILDEFSPTRGTGSAQGQRGSRS